MSDRLPALLELLDSPEVRQRIAGMIEELGCIEPHDAEELVGTMDRRLHGIAESLRDVCFDDDTTEATNMLPWIWLELRFEWMRYNLQMQYQTILQGTANPLLMARGAALSFILEAVEQHLDAESGFLVQKIAAAMRANRRSVRSMAPTRWNRCSRRRTRSPGIPTRSRCARK